MLRSNNRRMTRKEIADYAGYTVNKTSAMLKNMVVDGVLIKENIGDLAYYYCNDNAEEKFEESRTNHGSRDREASRHEKPETTSIEMVKNGKLNALFVAQTLLGEDIFFFNEGEISFDGTHHRINGIQINAAVVSNYPGLIENANTLAMGLADCMMYVERNSSLMCPISMIDHELRPYIYHEDLTGITLMHLFAWHLLKIALGDPVGNAFESMDINYNNKSDFTIYADTRVLNGIPNSHRVLEEMVHSFLEYNNDDRNISVNFVGFRNYDV